MRNFGHMKPLIILLLLPLLAAGCRHTPAGRVSVERLTSADALNSSPGGASSMMIAFGAGYDTTEWRTFARQFGQSEAMRVFGHDVDSIMPDLSAFTDEINELYDNIAATLPAAQLTRRIYATVIPYSQSVIIPPGTDSVVIIGLNHYLGSDYDGYSSFAAYQRARKEPSRMTRDIAEATVRAAYPFQAPDSPTLLQRMLYEGAIATVLAHLMPGDAAKAIEIPEDDFDRLSRYEKEIWQRMVGSDMLFNRSVRLANAILREGASASVLGERAPSLAGRFIGWRIAEAYLDSHPDSAAETLLRPGYYLADQTLREARYAP